MARRFYNQVIFKEEMKSWKRDLVYKMDRGKARSVRGGSSQHWCDPIGKIERLQEALAKIKHIAQFP
jgi:hypothetical protein